MKAYTVRTESVRNPGRFYTTVFTEQGVECDCPGQLYAGKCYHTFSSGHDIDGFRPSTEGSHGATV